MADSRYHNAYWPEVVTCESCGKTARPKHKYPLPPESVFCPFCGEEVEFKTVKPSHGDSVRAMSDEELARWIWAVQSGIEREELLTTDSWLDWLQSPVMEESK